MYYCPSGTIAFALPLFEQASFFDLAPDFLVLQSALPFEVELTPRGGIP